MKGWPESQREVAGLDFAYREKAGKDLILLASEIIVLQVTEEEKEGRKDTSMKLWQP